MATVRDVAALAGVSVASVSRVLNEQSTVARVIRERVEAAVAELGYRPHAAARSLRSQRTQSIGLVIGDITNPFFTALAKAVEAEARRAGYTVLLGNGQESVELQDAYLQELQTHRLDGLLLSPAPGESAVLREVAAAGRPVVLVDRSVDGLGLPVVKTDDASGVIALIDHLVALGHRRIAIISGPLATSSGRERRDAFCCALMAHGLDLPADYAEEGDFRRESGAQAMARLMSLHEPPTVVFAADNLMALGALQWARRHGIAVPESVGIASFDDVPWFEVLDPPLTTVAQPIDELGRAAVRTLLAVLDGEKPLSISLPVQLVVRRSCGEVPR